MFSGGLRSCGGERRAAGLASRMPIDFRDGTQHNDSLGQDSWVPLYPAAGRLGPSLLTGLSR